MNRGPRLRRCVMCTRHFRKELMTFSGGHFMCEQCRTRADAAEIATEEWT